MKIYVDRDEVLKICNQYGVVAVKHRIEELPTVTEIADAATSAKGKTNSAI